MEFMLKKEMGFLFLLDKGAFQDYFRQREAVK